MWPVLILSEKDRSGSISQQLSGSKKPSHSREKMMKMKVKECLKRRIPHDRDLMRTHDEPF
jgi:hypothetical protein